MEIGASVSQLVHADSTVYAAAPDGGPTASRMTVKPDRLLPISSGVLAIAVQSADN
jgi:hypothetical protein